MSQVSTRALDFELRAGESLLEGLERTGHAVEFQCRSGYCGACRIPVVAGQVSYQNPPLAFVATGEVLACCSQPIGDVVLDIDVEKVQQRA